MYELLVDICQVRNNQIGIGSNLIGDKLALLWNEKRKIDYLLMFYSRFGYLNEIKYLVEKGVLPAAGRQSLSYAQA